MSFTKENTQYNLKRGENMTEFAELRELILMDLIKNQELYVGRTLNLAEMKVLHQSADILFAKRMRETKCSEHSHS